MCRPGLSSSLATLAILLALVGCTLSGGSEAPDRLPSAKVVLAGRILTVKVADTPALRTNGLQGHPEPDDSTGMLFVWEDEAPRSFALKSVEYPIDVVFIGPDSRVSQIDRLEPDGRLDAMAETDSRYVLELRGGWAGEYGLAVGDPFTYLGEAQ